MPTPKQVFQLEKSQNVTITHHDVGKAFQFASPEQRAILLNCLVNYLELHVSTFDTEDVRGGISRQAAAMQPHLNQNTIDFLHEVVDRNAEISR